MPGCAGWAILGDVVRKVRNVLEGASGAAGSALLVDRTGGRHSLKRLVSAHTQPMQEHLPRISTALLLHPHPISDFAYMLFSFLASIRYKLSDQVSHFRSQRA